MNHRYLKILIAGIFLQTNISLAQSTSVNINNTNQQVLGNISADENCVQTPRPENLEPSEYWYDQNYTNCLARNKTRAQQRQYVETGRKDAEEVLKGLKEPVNNCKQTGAAGEYDYGYSNCMQQYATDKRDYDRRAQAERTAKAEEEKSASAANLDQSKLENTSATGSMAEIEKKNKKGNELYTLAGVALAGLGATKFAEGQACASSCPTGCCPAVMGLVAAGAAYMLLNGKANAQAAQHAASAIEACQTFNKLSSAQKDCSGADMPKPPTITELYNDDGKCKATAAAGCVSVGGGSGITKISSNCKDSSGKSISCITSGLNNFKQNPDGSIKVKTPTGEKTYKLSDFADKKSMMAAGLTAAQADALMNDLYGKNGILAKAGLEAKELSNGSGKKFSDLLGSGNSSALSNLDAAKNENKKFNEKLDPTLARRPSSEGLTREFNGDLIGSAGDDIFTMMKRRYILKNEQDTFIAP